MPVQHLAIAKGYGCDAVRLTDLDVIKEAAVQAWTKDKPSVLEIPEHARDSPADLKRARAATASSALMHGV